MKPEVASASSITGGSTTDSVTCVNSTSDSERADGNFRQNGEIMVNMLDEFAKQRVIEMLPADEEIELAALNNLSADDENDFVTVRYIQGALIEMRDEIVRRLNNQASK